MKLVTNDVKKNYSPNLGIGFRLYSDVLRSLTEYRDALHGESTVGAVRASLIVEVEDPVPFIWTPQVYGPHGFGL